MNKIDRKDAVGLMWSFCAIAMIPATVWAMRPRPLAARTAPQLIELTRAQTLDEAIDIMSARYNGWSTNQNPDVRWQAIKQSMLEFDAELPESKAVLATAKAHLPHSDWPLFAKPGYLNSRKVWLIASSSPYDNGLLFCGNTSDAERRQHKVEHFTRNMKVVVVNAETPHQRLLNEELL